MSARYYINMKTYWVKWNLDKLVNYYKKNIRNYSCFEFWLADLVEYDIVRIVRD